MTQVPQQNQYQQQEAGPSTSTRKPIYNRKSIQGKNGNGGTPAQKKKEELKKKKTGVIAKVGIFKKTVLELLDFLKRYVAELL